MEPVAVAQFPEADPGACARAARRRFYRQRSFDRRRAASPERRELIRQRETWKEDVLAGLGARARHALRCSRGVTARLCEAEAEILARIHERSLHESVAQVKFDAFCSEVLQMNGRTARRRLELLRLLRRCPALLEAFRAGVMNRTQILALAPIVDAANAAGWVARMKDVPVHEIKDCVRMALAARGPAIAVPPDDTRVTLAFSAPETVGLALEHGIETTRRVLGWDAPRGTCLAAILAEAESSLPEEHAEESGDQGSPDGGSDASPGDGDALDVDRNASTENRVHGTMDRGTDRGIGGGNSGAVAGADERDSRHPALDRALDRFRPRRRKRSPYVPYAHASDAQIRAARTLLRGYERRLVHAGRLAQLLIAPGPDRHLDQLLHAWKELQALSRPLYVLEARLLYRLQQAMALEALGYFSIVEFMTRDLLVSDRKAAHLLLQGKAFESTCFRQAFIQGRVGRGHIDLLDRPVLRLTSWWLERAQTLTRRQFAREVRFLNRLHAAEDGDTLEILLLSPPPWAAIEAWLRKQLFLVGLPPDFIDRDLDASGLALHAHASTDPAENPIVLARLEKLLDLWILAREEHRARASAGAKTVSTGRHHRIVIVVETWVAEQWDRLVGRVRRLSGWVPPWAAAVLLLAAATETWEAVHKEFRPTQYKILERDGYRCRAPACTARTALEVHHLIFRSHDGDDDPENLITLCHAHHHHAVHRGTLRIKGRAPDRLVWEIGTRRGFPPRWIYRGERLVFAASLRRDATPETLDQAPEPLAWTC